MALQAIPVIFDAYFDHVRRNQPSKNFEQIGDAELNELVHTAQRRLCASSSTRTNSSAWPPAAQTIPTLAIMMAMMLASACRGIAPATGTLNPPTSTLPLATLDPGVIVLYADLEINSGGPRLGQTCFHPTYPALRIWGDGLAFARIPYQAGIGTDQLYTGRLLNQQIDDLLNYLTEQGFFGSAMHDSANPAADYLHVGANQHGISFRHVFGNLEPDFYAGLLAKLKPLLTLMTAATTGNSRIDPLLNVQCSTQPAPN